MRVDMRTTRVLLRHTHTEQDANAVLPRFHGVEGGSQTANTARGESLSRHTKWRGTIWNVPPQEL